MSINEPNRTEDKNMQPFQLQGRKELAIQAKRRLGLFSRDYCDVVATTKRDSF